MIRITIGSLHQSNRQHKSWADFYAEERLQPLVKMAVDSRELGKSDIQQFDKLYAKLPELFDLEPPALIHGDLWSGNFLIDIKGIPFLIDPAVYLGHREMDLALTTLFGGFGATFYEAYQQHYPLSPGFQQRIKLWCLYPLLVHVNLFGGGYSNQLRSHLNAYL
nr:fructosamine kinase family protein [Mucilaginibacter pedocola]